MTRAVPPLRRGSPPREAHPRREAHPVRDADPPREAYPRREAEPSREAYSRSEALGGANKSAAVPPVAGGCWVPILCRSVRTLSHAIGHSRPLKLETLFLD